MTKQRRPQTIILGKKKEFEMLTDLAPQLRNSACLLEATWEIDRIPAQGVPRLMVATDAFAGGINLSLLEKIKKKWGDVSVICLIDRIDPLSEIELRSAGIIFLGSYQTFSKHAKEILDRLFGDPK